MSIDSGYEILRAVIDTYKPEGWAVEFGVYSGFSLDIIADHMPVIGFDSFKGLPEDWREGFPEGTFDTRGTDVFQSKSPYNKMLVEGWFEDTVPGFPFPPLALVHIDCDLYSSTVTALAGITSAVQLGTIFVFDEFQNYEGAEDHEAKAFDEWLAMQDMDIEHLGDYGEEAAYRISRIGKDRL